MKKFISILLCISTMLGITSLLTSPVSAAQTNNADTGESSNADKLTNNLFHNATYYNNDLASVCADLCCDVDDVSGYFPEDHSEQYSWWFVGQAFHVGIGYREIDINGSKKNLVSITFRGTGSTIEGILDFIKDYEHNYYEGQQALVAPYDFAVQAESYLNQFLSKYRDVRKRQIVYLISGYSIGGAAANLLGARLTNQNGGASSDRVFVYTFGAIKAIASSSNVKNGYGNIHNIYNYYDSWGPHGNHSVYGVSDPYYKFGNTHFCYFDLDHEALFLLSHDMGNYRAEVEYKRVEVSINRKAGVMNGGQWWTTSKRNLNITDWNYLYIYGSGDLSDGSLAGLNYPWYGINDDINMIVISGNITEIGEYEFSKYGIFKNLSTIYIPVSVNRIGSSAFDGCDSLSDIYYSGTRAQWNSINVDYSEWNYPLQNATVHCTDDETPSNDNTPARSVFEYGSCGSDMIYVLYKDGTLEITGTGEMTSHPWSKKCVDRISEVLLSDGITSICYGAFENCISLREWNIPDSIVHISKNAFYNTAWYNNQPYGLLCRNNVLYGFKGSYPQDLVVPQGTRIIADYAFCSYGGYYISSITFNNELEYIGNWAFCFCEGLTEVNIGDSVKVIGEEAFCGCENLKTVILGRGIEELGSLAFAYNSIENFYILSDKIRSLSEEEHGFVDVFADYLDDTPNLTIYAIESKLSYEFKNIAEHQNCKCIIFEIKDNKAAVSLHLCGDCENYSIPERILQYPVTSLMSIERIYTTSNGNVTSITNYVKNLTIPKTLTEDYTYDVGGYTESYSLREVLREHISLENIFVVPDNPKYTSVDGVLYNKDVSELLVCPMQKKEVHIPDSVYIITGDAFGEWDGSEYTNDYGLTNKHTLYFGNGFGKDSPDTDIGYYSYNYVFGNRYVLRECKTVEDVYISDAFNVTEDYYNEELNSVMMMKAFPDLKAIHAADGSLKYSDYDGVLYDKSMTKLIAIPPQKTAINIPATVNDLSMLSNRYIEHRYYTSDSFSPCDSFIVSNDNPYFQSVDGIIFSKDMTELVLYPAGKTDDAYTISDTVQKICQRAFINCDNLKNITVPDSVTEMGLGCIGHYSQGNYNGYDMIDGVTIYGYSASESDKYAEDNGIPFVSIGKTEFSAEYTYKILYDGTLELTKYRPLTDDDFVFPQELRGRKISRINSPYSDMFSDAKNITRLDFPDSLKLITNHFQTTENLSEINFSENSELRVLESYTFAGAKKLSKVTLGNKLVRIMDHAFYNCPGLKEITIPYTVSYIGDYALGYYAKYDESGEMDTETKMDGFTIYGYSGTAAEYYAKRKRFNFVSLGEPPALSDEEKNLINYEYRPLDDGSIELLTYYGNDRDLNIPSQIENKKVTQISDDLIPSNPYVNNIVIPNTVKHIGTAFGGSEYKGSYIESITFENGCQIEEFVENAFLNNSYMREITVPYSVKTIGAHAIGYNQELEWIECYDEEYDETYYDIRMVYNKINGFKITGYKGSAAEAYANENGFEFIALEGSPILLGDVDADGSVTVIDATYIQRKVAELPNQNSFTEAAGDTDGDGKLTVMDATYIQKWLALLVKSDRIGKAVS